MTSRNSWMNGKRARPSSIALRGKEITVPPGQTVSKEQQALSPPPTEEVEEHYRKPLPAPPAARNSATSTLSKQLQLAFDTPRKNVEDGGGDRSPWSATEEADVADMLDKVGFSPDSPVSHMPLPKLETKEAQTEDIDFPNTPPDELLATQSKTSVQKISRRTRDANQSGPRPSVPSGNTISQKIKQLMGLDVNTHNYGVDESNRESMLLPISPMTPTSSIYSQEGLEATISEPDSEIYGSFDDIPRQEDGDDALPEEGEPIEWKDWWRPPTSPGSVPQALNVIKRSSEQTAPSPRDTYQHGCAISHGEPLSPRSPPPGQLASDDTHKAPSPPISPRRSFALVGHKHSSSSTSSNPKSKTLYSLTPMPARKPETDDLKDSRRKESFSTREYKSRVRIAPPAAFEPVEWHAHEMSQRPDSALSKTSKMSGVSSATFGRGNHPLRTPYPPSGKRMTQEEEEEEDGDRINDDDEDEDDWTPTSPGRGSSSALTVGKGGDAQKLSKGKEVLTKHKSILGATDAIPKTRQHGDGQPSRQEPETIRSPEQPKEQRSRRNTGGRFFFLLPGKSKRSDGQTTPLPIQNPPAASKTSTIVEHARAAAGIQTKAEKRREELKSKIQVVTPPPPGKKGANWF